MKNKKVLLLVIFLVALFLRIFLVGKIPSGVTNDEANVAYDTFLLVQAGKDQWGKSWPLEFKGFGDYRLPVYQYLLFPLIKIFGMRSWATRLPSVILGSSTILLIYFFILVFFKKFKEKEFLALIAALILSFNPWHFGMSRCVMEANVGLFFTLLAIFFILRDKKNDWLFGGIFTVISFYTYYSLRVFLPLFYVYLLLFYKKWSKRKIFNFILIIAFLSFSIIFNTLKTGGGLARVKQVNIFRDIGIVNRINEYRGSCLSFYSVFRKRSFYPLLKSSCVILFNRPVFWLRQFILNYFHHFSFSFLFFGKFERGWQFLPPSSFFYFFNLPFFVFGLFGLLINFKKQWRFLIFWLLIAPLADSITGEGHYARSFIMIIPVIIFISYGYYLVFSFLRKNFQKSYKLLPLPILGFSLFFITQFFVNYFIYFPKKHSKYSHYEYKPLFDYLKEVEHKYENIYISRKVRDTKQYIFYLYYNQIPAEEFFNSRIIRKEEKDGWVAVKRINKYWFIDDVGEIKKYPPNSLLVVAPEEIKREKVIKVISFLDSEPAFYILETNELFYGEKKEI